MKMKPEVKNQMEVEVLVAKHPIRQRSFYSNLYETGKVNLLSLFFLQFCIFYAKLPLADEQFPIRQ